MILVLLIRFQILFVFQSEAFHRHSRTHGCQTKLFYRNQDDEKRSAKPLLVPVISPIPGQPPLVVGASTSIKPTRMQWMTIEDSLLSNEKKSDKKQEEENEKTENHMMAGVTCQRTAVRFRLIPPSSKQQQHPAPPPSSISFFSSFPFHSLPYVSIMGRRAKKAPVRAKTGDFIPPNFYLLIGRHKEACETSKTIQVPLLCCK